MPMATAANWAEDNEWELVNDDGFVYKRKKRLRVDDTAASTSASALSLPDPVVEEKNRRERKKMALIKLKEKYRQEIHQWEHLSNTLNNMQKKSQIVQLPKSRKLNDASTSSLSDLVTTSPVQPEQSPGSLSRQLLDELLSQADAQDAVIQDVSNLCDMAEGLCSAREEKFKKSFTELPIWASSPHELITSLCQD